MLNSRRVFGWTPRAPNVLESRGKTRLNSICWLQTMFGMYLCLASTACSTLALLREDREVLEPLRPVVSGHRTEELEDRCPGRVPCTTVDVAAPNEEPPPRCVIVPRMRGVLLDVPTKSKSNRDYTSLQNPNLGRVSWLCVPVAICSLFIMSFMRVCTRVPPHPAIRGRGRSGRQCPAIP